MRRFLLIAVYGSTIAIALAFTFAEYGNEGKTTVRKKYMDDFEPEFEDALKSKKEKRKKKKSSKKLYDIWRTKIV